MRKIRLTKNELKQQRDALIRFNRYLPMLQLKKQQLQVEIGKAGSLIEKLNAELKHIQEGLYLWVDVFAEGIDLKKLIQVKNINRKPHMLQVSRNIHQTSWQVVML